MPYSNGRTVDPAPLKLRPNGVIQIYYYLLLLLLYAARMQHVQQKTKNQFWYTQARIRKTKHKIVKPCSRLTTARG